MGVLMDPIFIKDFLPKQVLNIAYSYSVIKFSNKLDLNVERQSKSLAAEFGDYLMETLLDLSTPVIEQNVQKKLFPTYTYIRVYDKGSDLKVHTDREACEYTVALCLGSDPQEQPYELFVGEEDENSDYKYYKNTGEYKRIRIDHKFPMVPNDAVIFKGMDKIHWREYCQHDHYVTVFLHYVDQEGPFKDFKFDKRDLLGAPSVR